MTQCNKDSTRCSAARTARDIGMAMPDAGDSVKVHRLRKLACHLDDHIQELQDELQRRVLQDQRLCHLLRTPETYLQPCPCDQLYIQQRAHNASMMLQCQDALDDLCQRRQDAVQAVQQRRLYEGTALFKCKQVLRAVREVCHL